MKAQPRKHSLHTKKITFFLCSVFAALHFTAQAEILIHDSAFAKISSATPASTVLNSVSAEAGDYLVVLAASNLSDQPTENDLILTLSNGAALDTVVYHMETDGGPSAHRWYARVLNDGTIQPTVGNGNYMLAGAYVIRPTAGETLTPVPADASDGSGSSSAITNSYSFSEPADGVLVEVMSTLAADGTVATSGITLDYVNKASKVKRSAGSLTLTNATGFTSGYTLTGSNSKASVSGIALIDSGLQPPPPVASPHRTRTLPEGNYNVLFISIDDLRPLINAYGETEPLRPITPNLDRLADSGIMFANAHCQQAVCNASRASLMTGLRPDTTRCWKLNTFFRDTISDTITLPQHFGEQGYRVHGIGKIYHGSTSTKQDAAISWNDGWSSSDTGYEWYESAKAGAEDAGTSKVSATDAGEVDRNGDPITDEAYYDGYAAAQGVARISEYAADYQTNNTPFFLAVGFKKPHLPFNCPKTYWDLYNPAEIDLTGYTGIRQMPAGANKFAAPFGSEPETYGDITGTSDSGMPDATEARHLIHGYLACVSYIDTQAGKLLDALQDPDGNPGTDDSIVDNTIIIVWGDHGFHLGDHNGFWAKHSNYETATRAPLIVRAPGMEDLGSAGSRSIGLVELVDIYPTLLDLCSLPAPSQPDGLELQGTTFLPLLEDPAQPWKKAAFSQYHRSSINDNAPGDLPVANKGPGMGYSIRTVRYRYTEWWRTESTDETDRHIVASGITAPELIELYDYVTDPGETINLATNPAYAGLMTELSGLLNDDDPAHAGDGWKKSSVDAPDAFPETFWAWRAGYLTPGVVTGDLDPDGNPDGDTMTNALEYKFGTHPLEAGTSPVAVHMTDGSIALRYPDVTNRTNIELRVEACTNLSMGAWSSADIAHNNIGIQRLATLRESSASTDVPSRFLRLQAEVP